MYESMGRSETGLHPTAPWPRPEADTETESLSPNATLFAPSHQGSAWTFSTTVAASKEGLPLNSLHLYQSKPLLH